MINKDTDYGSKRHIVGAHYGFRDWLAQRVTAVLQIAYTLIIIILIVFFRNDGYEGWSDLFSHNLMKLASLLIMVSICYHAWVGIRDLWMDYIKPVGIRLSLQILTIVWLLGCGIWMFEILWKN